MSMRPREGTVMSPHVAGTTPYVWPFDGDLDPARTVLLAVVEAGQPPMADEVAARIVSLAAALRSAGGRTIIVRTRVRTASDWTSRGYEGLLGSGLSQINADFRILAPGFDPFYQSTLESALQRSATHLLVVGGPLETTVHSTMRSANDRGLDCLLVSDACEALDAALYPASIAMIEMCGGILGAVGRTDDVVAALEQFLPAATA